MTGWTQSSATKQIDALIAACDKLGTKSRTSAEWTRWSLNCRSFLEEIFGPVSRHFQEFEAIPWRFAGNLFIDTGEMLRDGMRRLEGTNDYVSRKHQAAAVEQLRYAKGLLESARDELKRKGLASVFVSKERGAEASGLMDVMRLIERQWRKAIRTPPGTEVQVQNALEDLLNGAGIRYTREAEMFPYASKSYRPDFVIPSLNMVIETKLCTSEKRERAIVEEISADIAAYSSRFRNLFFAIYDLGVIRDVDRFVEDLALAKSGVIVRVVKH